MLSHTNPQLFLASPNSVSETVTPPELIVTFLSPSEPFSRNPSVRSKHSSPLLLKESFHDPSGVVVPFLTAPSSWTRFCQAPGLFLTGLWLIRLLTPVTGKLPFITDLLSEHNIRVRFKAALDPSPAALPSGSCSFFRAPHTIGPVHEIYVLFADSRLFFLPFFTNTQLSILFHQNVLIPSTLPCCHHLCYTHSWKF